MWYCGFLSELQTLLQEESILKSHSVMKSGGDRWVNLLRWFCDDAQECVGNMFLKTLYNSRLSWWLRSVLWVHLYFQSTELLQLLVHFMKSGWYCMYFYCTLFVMNLYRHCANITHLLILREGMNRFQLCS